MEPPTPRVVIDTNLFVSGLITPRGRASQLLAMWRHSQFVLLTSDELIQELAQVLERDSMRTKYQISREQASLLILSLRVASEQVRPLELLPVHCRDPKDDKFLAVALGGSADYLVTGDEDLLTLAGHSALQGLRIMTAAAFVEAHAR